ILTSASLHDSQAAIPLARMTGDRLDHCYELMDAAYDSREIGAHARRAGRVAIIDANPRRDAERRARLAGEARAQRNAGHVRHDRVRYRQRSSVERVNSALKDSYGGRHVRVRGHTKVAGHLFFGVLALTVQQLMRLTI
ncbi:MAG: transposase, partial [Aestuariivita sp.]|nr:transposase [Aestuariivita sp.]